MNINSCKKNGSALLIVLLVMTALSLSVFSLTKIAQWNIEFVLQKQKKEQLYYMVDGVLNYGIALCRDRFEVLQEKAKKGISTISLDIGTWKLESHPNYQGKLLLTIEENNIKIKASLTEGQEIVINSECFFVKKELQKNSPFFIVEGWKMHV